MSTAGRRNEQGVALIVALLALVVVAGIGTLMFARTVNEMRHSRDDAAIVQTLMLARGGANVGSALLGHDVKTELREIVMATTKPGRWAYGSDQKPVRDDAPDASSVVTALTPVAVLLQKQVDLLVCDEEIIPADGAAVMRLRIHFTEQACSEFEPAPLELPRGVHLPQPRFVSGHPRSGSGEIGIQEYALPFVLIAEGELGAYRRNVVMQGEYVFEVGQASFAHYAYFTNRETTSGRIWFTDDTLIDGPVHTNGNFSFAYDPWFGGRVTSAGCQNKDCNGERQDGAYFYGYVLRGECLRYILGICLSRAPDQDLIDSNNMTPSPTSPSLAGNSPAFTAGVEWKSEVVPLPTSADDQLDVANGKGRHDKGLVFGNLYSLDLWAGDHAERSPTRNAQGKWVPPPQYQYVRSCTGANVNTCQTYRFDENGRLEEKQPNGSWQVRHEPFNGVLFVQGKVDRFRGPARADASDDTSAPPALARFAEITLASTGDIRITRDLRYEEPPCSSQPSRNGDRSVTPAECNNLGHKNVLGVYSQGGDILVGNATGDATKDAPKSVHVHAVLMSGTNQIRVENYQLGSSRGNFNLLGGMIQENRGIFGQFSGRSQTSGFNRVYTYDPRMRRGVAPPFFPTTGLGEVDGVRYFSFGQREQLY